MWCVLRKGVISFSTVTEKTGFKVDIGQYGPKWVTGNVEYIDLYSKHWNKENFKILTFYPLNVDFYERPIRTRKSCAILSEFFIILRAKKL